MARYFSIDGCIISVVRACLRLATDYGKKLSIIHDRLGQA